MQSKSIQKFKYNIYLFEKTIYYKVMSEREKKIIWYTFVVILLAIAIIGDVQMAGAMI